MFNSLNHKNELVQCFFDTHILSKLFLTSKFPVKCFGCKIVLFNKIKDGLSHFLYGFIAALFQKFPVDDTKPDFYLVHPGTVLWCIDKTNPVAFIHKERFPAFHTLKYAFLPFRTKIGCNGTFLCNQFYKPFGFMGIKTITDNDIVFICILCYKLPHSIAEIFLISCAVQIR